MIEDIKRRFRGLAGFLVAMLLVSQLQKVSAQAEFVLDDRLSGGKKVMNSILIAESPTTVVMGDILEINAKYFSRVKGTAPINVTIVARELRISGQVTFDLSAAAGDGSNGGNLTVVADRIVIAEDGILNFVSCGSNGRDQKMATLHTTDPDKPGNGGNGGNLTVCCPTIMQQVLTNAGQPLKKLSGESNIAPTGSGFSGIMRAVYWSAFAVYAPGGYPGSYSFTNFIDRNDPPLAGKDGGVIREREPSAATEHLPAGTMGDWVALCLKKLMVDLQGAELTGNVERMQDLVRKSVDLVSRSFLPSAAGTEEYKRMLADLKIMRNQIMPPLRKQTLKWEDNLGHEHQCIGFIERDVDIFHPMPTAMLVRSIETDSGQIFGMMQRDQGNLAKLYFEVELLTDPAHNSSLAAAATKEGLKLGRLFTRWKSTGVDFKGPGIVDCTTYRIDNVMQVTLVLSESEANLSLVRLALAPGMPFVIECETDEAGVNGKRLKAEIPLRISFAKRSANLVKVVGENMENKGADKALVDYYVEDGKLVSLNPSLMINPGQSVKWRQQGNIISSTIVVIPPTAVSWESDKFISSFNQVNGSLLQVVTLESEVPPIDPANNNLPLDFVEAFLHFKDGGSAKEEKLGPYRLTARRTDGSRRDIQLFKLPGIERVIWVEGKISYDQERSFMSFKTPPVSHTTIHIQSP